MKYLFTFFLLTGFALAENEIEVGSPHDCVLVGTKNDSEISQELNQLQQQITDCLAPQEEEVSEIQSGNHHEIVSQ